MSDREFTIMTRYRPEATPWYRWTASVTYLFEHRDNWIPNTYSSGFHRTKTVMVYGFSQKAVVWLAERKLKKLMRLDEIAAEREQVTREKSKTIKVTVKL